MDAQFASDARREPSVRVCEAAAPDGCGASAAASREPAPAEPEGREPAPAEPATPAPDDTPTSRLVRLMGTERVERLAASWVMVLGLGGVGSNCLEALARGGVGGFVLVDGDVVQPSNINRQAIAYHSTVGRRKVEVARALVADINPAARTIVRDAFVLPADFPALYDEAAAQVRALGGTIDYVVDAIDTISTKLVIAQASQERGFRLISAMGAANRLRPECLAVADIYDTRTCPMCRVMRRECRKRGVQRLRVVYSSEPAQHVPEAPGADRRERTELGTASYMPPIMGQMIAAEVIRDLAGLDEL